MMNGMMMNPTPFMRKEAPTRWLAGVYCRLSKDDEQQGESNSITNQRELLTAVCKEQGWTIAKVYQDDGYTGLNMERPGLQQLLEDVRNGRINLVITKDLSRLGRNYLETGQLIENFFPKNRTRYIAFNDNIDTSTDANDILPFKNVLNEMYSKDISKKVHASYLVSANKGFYTGVVPPFGYLKDPEQKGHLIIDEETAPYVREIFRMAAEGRGPNYISRWLGENKIPCPCWWNRQRGFRKTLTKWEIKDPENGRFAWDFSIVKDMIMNPVYIGAIASQKRHYKFKVGNLGDKKPNEWIVIENCHEPIVDRSTFEIANEKLQYRQRPRKTGDFTLFAGIIRCGDCGGSMCYRGTAPHSPVATYACKTYTSRGKGFCTQHRVPYDLLEEKVLNTIRTCAKSVAIDPDDVEAKLEKAKHSQEDSQHDTLLAAIARDEDRMLALGKMVAKLYEDRMMGTLSEDNFQMLMKNTQDEQQELEKRLTDEKKQLAGTTVQGYDSKQWIDLISQYTDIEKLDSETLNRLVRQIVVHEDIDEDYVRHIRLEIHFNFQPIPAIDQYDPDDQRPYLHPDHSDRYVMAQ